VDRFGWSLGSGEHVVDRPPPSHVHGPVKPLLTEALSRIQASGRDRFDEEVGFGSVIGKSTCVATTSRDQIVYAVRGARHGHTRFVLNGSGEPCSTVFVVLEKATDGSHYVLITAWIGLRSPVEPWERNATDESRIFWDQHALLWGSEDDIDQSTCTAQCPW
jgi:hypothetical protein